MSASLTTAVPVPVPVPGLMPPPGRAAVPLSPLAVKLRERLALKRSADLSAYRKALADAAAPDAREPSGKDLDRLAGLLADLGLSADDFDADLAVLREHAAKTARLAEAPDPERSQREHEAEIRRLKDLEEQGRQAGNDARALGLAYIGRLQAVAYCKEAIAALERENPRVFGA